MRAGPLISNESIEARVERWSEAPRDWLRYDRVAKFLRILIGAVSVFVILLFVVTALMRVRYPYELEELEGNVFLAALRVFHGQTVYGPPSLEFIPYMYPPGYYYVAAALGRVMGMSLATMRVVSIASTLGCFGMIFGLVWTEARRALPAVAAAGLYAGCYTVCNEWFDLGRLDSMFVLLVLVAIYATRRMHPVVAAMVWVLAFQTKQSILPVAVLMLCCDWRRVQRALLGLAALLVGVVGSVAWMDHSTNGWYRFYVFAVPKANADLSLRTLAMFWPQQMLRPLLLALMVIVAAVVFRRPSLRSPATRVYLAACSLAPVFWIVYAHGGSTMNALMPVYALVAVLFGLALQRMLGWLQSQQSVPVQAATLLLLLAALAQEAAGVYNPGDYRPYTEMRESAAAVVGTVRTLPGDVYVLQHPYYEWLAGKPTHADLVSVKDALRAADAGTRTDLRAQIGSVLDQHRFGALVMDQPDALDGLDAAAGETTWHGYYNSEWRIPGTTILTRPDWVLVHCGGQTAACTH